MPRETNWKCDNCGLVKEFSNKPPLGWSELSFFNGKYFVRHAFCCYACLAEWASKRYDKQPSYIGEEVNK